VTSGPTYRERAARNLAAVLVAWATYRIVVVTGLMLTGVISAPADPMVAAAVERYSSLKGHVPTTGTVGYVGPTEPEPGHQMLARYILAPIPVAPDDAHDLVLVDLDNDAALAQYLARTKATVLVHPRPGLAIIERAQRAP
jgi:hypothetical protein